jgi:hypothetical protein
VRMGGLYCRNNICLWGYALNLCALREGREPGYFEHTDELSGSIKGDKFRDHLETPRRKLYTVEVLIQ